MSLGALAWQSTSCVTLAFCPHFVWACPGWGERLCQAVPLPMPRLPGRVQGQLKGKMETDALPLPHGAREGLHPRLPGAGSSENSSCVRSPFSERFINSSEYQKGLCQLPEPGRPFEDWRALPLKCPSRQAEPVREPAAWGWACRLGQLAGMEGQPDGQVAVLPPGLAALCLGGMGAWSNLLSSMRAGVLGQWDGWVGGCGRHPTPAHPQHQCLFSLLLPWERGGYQGSCVSPRSALKHSTHGSSAGLGASRSLGETVLSADPLSLTTCEPSSQGLFPAGP